ncbi:hypothetical protein CWE09_10295 [Aliidiomarina minuta]|uniref:Translesion DNA synthesis-associated protein ImuA n=1 Tax=Aliidiomarina minuta TaxID=880057 RepID=A0A432WAB4_9GAMM|nr:hypothetical protein [Aliidiomarina minuta]RUO27054.1 hypothetical protein CWE09_10295 [Aliidiomarina minuta]
MQPLQDSSLQSLLQTGKLWQAGQQSESSQLRIATGHQGLDETLHGGLQIGQLHEVQVPRWFCGEVSLLRGALKKAGEQQEPVFWLNPPATPYAAGLSYIGSAPASHIVLTELGEDEAVWALELILRAGCAAVAAAWCSSLSATAARRLQRAVQGTSTLAVIFSAPVSTEARSYQTRLRAHLEHGQLRWQIIKRPGGWPCELDWEAVPTWRS